MQNVITDMKPMRGVEANPEEQNVASQRNSMCKGLETRWWWKRKISKSRRRDKCGSEAKWM